MMKTNSPGERWKRLVVLARQAPPKPSPAADGEIDPGLATRIAAEWSSSPTPGLSPLDLFERVGLGGAGVAVAAALLVAVIMKPGANTAEPLAFDTLLFAPQQDHSAEGGLLF